jgi:hypothetical protein
LTADIKFFLRGSISKLANVSAGRCDEAVLIFSGFLFEASLLKRILRFYYVFVDYRNNSFGIILILFISLGLDARSIFKSIGFLLKCKPSSVI